MGCESYQIGIGKLDKRLEWSNEKITQSDYSKTHAFIYISKWLKTSLCMEGEITILKPWVLMVL